MNRHETRYLAVRWHLAQASLWCAVGVALAVWADHRAAWFAAGAASLGVVGAARALMIARKNRKAH